MKKKIGILTQPLHDNYGGLLQAFALKSTLESLNFDVEIINRRKPYHSLKYRVSNFLNRLRGVKVKYSPSDGEKKIISKNTKYFTDTYIKDITSPIYTVSQLEAIKNKFDAFVIGSDQVWKPAYSPEIGNYFLDFVTDSKIFGVAYAASFGGDTWDYTAEQSVKCKENVHKFRAISVREDSGISLCKNNLNVDAVHVLDPTMLLNREDYIDLIEKEEKESGAQDILMHYVLDISVAKQKLIDQLSSYLGLSPISVTQKAKVSKESVQNNIQDCVYPTVTSWLNGFNRSKFVITDSFHGTVFSILFNKPFLVLGNPGRGNARFFSLLKMFGLEDRFLMNAGDATPETINGLGEIDWDRVNEILKEKRLFSLDFLRDNLVF